MSCLLEWEFLSSTSEQEALSGFVLHPRLATCSVNAWPSGSCPSLLLMLQNWLWEKKRRGICLCFFFFFKFVPKKKASESVLLPELSASAQSALQSLDSGSLIYRVECGPNSRIPVLGWLAVKSAQFQVFPPSPFFFENKDLFFLLFRFRRRTRILFGTSLNKQLSSKSKRNK